MVDCAFVEASRRRALHLLGGIGLVLAGIAPLAGMAHADENWDNAQAAFEVCLANFPRTRIIHEALTAQGWRYEGNTDGLKIFTRNGFRAVAATQGSSQTASRCAVSSSRLSPEAATAFASKIAARLEGGKAVDLTAQGVSAGWEGALRGQTLRLGVIPDGEFGVMRGAIVVLGEM